MTYDHLERGHRRTDTQSSRAPLITPFGGDQRGNDTHRRGVAVEDLALGRGQADCDAHTTRAPLISFGGDQTVRDTHMSTVAVGDTLDLEWGRHPHDTQTSCAPLSDGRGQSGTGAHCGGAPAVNPLERGHQLPGTQTKRAPLNNHLGGDQPLSDAQGRCVAVEDFDHLERGHARCDTHIRRAPLNSLFGGDQTVRDTQKATVAVEDWQEGVT
jgi:hypothetical protein